MCAAKCRRPFLYTRSKSACRSKRTLWGNLLRLPDPERSPPPFATSAPAAGLGPDLIGPGLIAPGCESSANSGKGETLLTEAGLYRHALAALGAPARNYGAAGLGLHPRKKSVRLRAVTTVGLECALGHEKSLLLRIWVSLKAK